MLRELNPTRHLAPPAMALIGGLVALAGGWSPQAAFNLAAANGVLTALLGQFLPTRAVVALGTALPLASCLLPAGLAAAGPARLGILLAMAAVALHGARRAEVIAAAQERATPVAGGTWMSVVIEGEGPQSTARLLAPRPRLPRWDRERRRLSRRTERRPVTTSSSR